jgi:hypothetical protein
MEKELFDPRCLDRIEASKELHPTPSIHDSRGFKRHAVRGPVQQDGNFALATSVFLIH